MTPKTTKQWTVEGKTSFNDLKFHERAPIPELGDNDVLVKFHAASLNYRDLIIPLDKYPFRADVGIVPGSDGAGTVEEVGKAVTRFRTGDKVTPIFNQGHLGGDITVAMRDTGVGGAVNGTFRQYGTYNEEGLVHIPKNLNWLEAGSLSCAAVTAWNALFGLETRTPKPGDWVLVQGTGGVSLFALQFAKAAGATVVATTSSAEKEKLLMKIGADHVVNYKEEPAWGEKAKELTPGGLGFAHIVEIGGPTTIKQSLAAVQPYGVITIIGFVGGVKMENPPGFLDVLNKLCTVRGILVGSRLQFEDMNRAIEAADIHPVLDEKVFKLEELKEAYQYMWEKKHVGKLCIQID